MLIECLTISNQQQHANSLPSRSPALWTTSCSLAGLEYIDIFPRITKDEHQRNNKRVQGYCIPMLEIMVPRVMCPYIYIITYMVIFYDILKCKTCNCCQMSTINEGATSMSLVGSRKPRWPKEKVWSSEEFRESS